MTDVWAEVFVEESKCIRGNLDHWALLVFDDRHSHVYSLQTLHILRDNNILVVGVPSHTTHLLQVHDEEIVLFI